MVDLPHFTCALVGSFRAFLAKNYINITFNMFSNKDGKFQVSSALQIIKCSFFESPFLSKIKKTGTRVAEKKL